MDFEKICMMYSMQEPFYGILLSSVLRVPTDKVSTLAVGVSGNVFKLFYNPGFVSKLSIDTCLACLTHEMEHIAFNHFSVFDGSPENQAEQQRRNIAADLEVNSYIPKNLLYNNEVQGLYPDNYGYKPELGAREYYRLIGPQDVEEQEGRTGLKGGKGTIIDDHSQWPTGLSESQKDVIEQAIEDMVIQAAEIVEKSCGSIPAGMQVRIDAIRKRKVKPAADWKRYVRRYLGNEFTEFIRKSKKRESRRFPDAAGNKHRRKSRVMVGIDTSGSVGMKEYEEFMNQIKSLSRTANFTIVECDYDIHKIFEYSGKMPNTVFGGGGTSFQPVVDLFISNGRKYDALIYFTDGYAPVPSNTPKDTLWVISSDGNKEDRNEFRKNRASVVYIPKQCNQE